MTVFKESAIWIWENLDNQTINNLLKEHAELHRDPEEKAKEKMQQELDYQLKHNPLVKAFMS
jgi:hypothetical protein